MQDLVDAFSNLRITVVGDALLDCWLEGEPERLGREAPVPVVRISHRVDQPGGAANTAANAAALGADVTLVAAIGRDDEGQRLERALVAHGVRTGACVRGMAPTPALHRVVAADQVLIRFDCMPRAAEVFASSRALEGALRDVWHGSDAVIVADYGEGAVDALLPVLCELQSEDPRLLVADSKRLGVLAPLHPTAVKPNWTEVAHLLGLDARNGSRLEQLSARGDDVLRIANARIAAVTLDLDGGVVFEAGERPHRTYAPASADAARHATGAGDTFVAAFTCALAAGARAPVAADLGALAASVAVRKRHTATCTAPELAAASAIGGKVLRGTSEVASVVASHRAADRRIVFTNGCFDILHRGHISYLERARSTGDVLIVGVNDDASVARLKGPERPVNTLEDRLAVLAALVSVDHLIAFSGDRPEDLLRTICPDVYVKGDDYTIATLPEASLVQQLGCRIEFLPLVEHRSTTRVIDRIRRAAVTSS